MARAIPKCRMCGSYIEEGESYCSTECYDAHHEPVETEVGAKFDEDKYQKVDLSLIPWEILSQGWDSNNTLYRILKNVHEKLNGECKQTVEWIFQDACVSLDISLLAVSLGYGEVKYARDNWRQGFGGDWRRFLKATLRHGKAILGDYQFYDGEEIEGYPKGNDHYGAVLFSLMVGAAEEEK